ncbi:hypothetical protein JZ751_007694 [Albula glossodonta]|uniref:Ig-like domain-containing protein n=1 Tax=Albula glossodonta TaxID=121402 RepID=A0A8T2MT10_9TELE|nr:hypothetical protein JZ751_007694 [Albula glossodonta]
MKARYNRDFLEPVSKPNITAKCLRDNITLSCFSSQGSEVTYSWETLPPCGNDSCVHLGQKMEIHLLPPSEPTSYVCATQNPASRATSDPVVLGVCSTPRSPAGTESSITKVKPSNVPSIDPKLNIVWFTNNYIAK